MGLRRHSLMVPVKTLLNRASAPPVGGLGGPHQRVAQIPQLLAISTLFDSGGDVLGGAAHLIDPVGQLSSLVGAEDHRICGYGGAFHQGTLLVGPLPARLAAVLPAPAHPGIGDVAAAPPARLRAGTTRHALRL
jgi:hypothetical protein